MIGISNIEIHKKFTPNFFVSNIYYKLYYFDLNSVVGSLTWKSQLQNISGKVIWIALIVLKFMTLYKNKSMFVLGYAYL